MRAYELVFKKNIITRQWRWRIKANNGKIIASSSESFWNKTDCERNAQITGFSITKHFTSAT
jgi:uncharacterized protein YegP (UPF0339 family)